MSSLGERHAASFRDPEGFIFTESKKIYRQVNQIGAANYDLLMKSGLYEVLTDQGLLLPHAETRKKPVSSDGYRIIEPQHVPFISYPYEWSFSQLQDAALLTLKIQQLAMDHGMTLKDASAYNVQFIAGRPIFIDTLSFEAYQEGSAWSAYKQFCQHFLAPLALMAHTDIRLSQLLRVHIDGIPLDLTSKLLPASTKLKSSLLLHIHAHAKSQSRHAADAKAPRQAKVSKTALVGIVSSLERSVRKLKLRKQGTEWGEYYTFTNYQKRAFNAKKKLVAEMLQHTGAKTVADLGGNDGTFTRLALKQGAQVVCADIDPLAVEACYKSLATGEQLLPLLVDLTNPPANIGWANTERDSFLQRVSGFDALMALAIVHHLAISNNLPLGKIAELFAKTSPWLIIEFVPKGDSQVDILLATRKDIFPEYTKKGFEAAFSRAYKIVEQNPVPGTKRTLYLMKRNNNLSHEIH